MTLEWLIRRFDDCSYQPSKFADPVAAIAGYRGDHNLNSGMHPKTQPDGSLKSAAVLVPVVNRPDGPTVLFTQRTDHLNHHPGQISFPGGRTEAHDAGPEQTALRETEEEVGLPSSSVRIIGQLDDYLTRTGFVVTPVVGIIEPPFRLQPDPFEVAEVFEVPLPFLLDADNHQRHSLMFEGRERFFYAMPYNDYFIWGATAGMLMNLYQLLSADEQQALDIL